MCWIPIANDPDWGFKEAPFYSDDLNMSQWFPLGAHTTCVSVFPGTNVRLSRHYHIFTTADPSVTTHNKALSKLHNQTWMGNIVVVALDKRTQSKVVQFPTRDIGLVDILISV